MITRSAMLSEISPFVFAAALRKYSRAVGRLEVRGDDGQPVGFATGFVVAPDLFVTCHHVLPTVADAARAIVQFDFHEGDDGRIASPTVAFLQPRDFFVTKVDADLTIVALAPASGARDRAISLSNANSSVEVGEPVLVIHHAAGEPLKLSTGQIIRVSKGFLLHYIASTAPGSAGAPVFDSQWNLLGVHHASHLSDTLPYGIQGSINEAIGAQLLVPLLEFSRSEDIAARKIDELIESQGTRQISPTTLIQKQKAMRDSVFISYAHADQEHNNWKERLLRQLRAIPSIEQVKIWDDSRIEAGDKWLEEIEFALKRTRLAILLVGPHFLTSKFVMTKELPDILEASENEGARILPLITDYVAYRRSALGKFQSFNDPSKPLESLDRAEQNRLLLALAEKVADLLEEV